VKLFLTGGEGQLGTELIRLAAASGIEIAAPTMAAMDLTDPGQVEAAFSAFRPAAVINAAAYTAVDRAETERELAFAVNAAAPAHMARLCARAGIPLIHISTDYVFNGRQRTPYREDDPVSPLGVYGRSKAEGEAAVRREIGAHLIVRTAWLYSPHGTNFLKTIVRLAYEKSELRIVDDQVGCPTCAEDLAEAVLVMAGRFGTSAEIPWGTYHYCGRGETSWFGLASHIVAVLAARRRTALARVLPIPTRDYPTPAARPAFSVLDCSRIQALFGISPRPWKAAVEKTLDRMLD
jgi:dTDP-4-dehydrorhamnose reductase